MKKVKTVFLLLIFCAAALIAEEPSTDEAPAPAEEPASGGERDEPVPGTEASGDGEPVIGEEAPGDGEPVIGNGVPDDETADDEPVENEDFNGAFVFEAPPLIIESVPFTGNRSFNDIYPNLTRIQKREVMSDEGGLRYAFEENETPVLIPAPDSGIDLYNRVMKRKPSHIVEALVLVPYMEKELDFLDIYNALGQIGEIQNQEVIYRNRNINSFVETTRLNNARNRRPVPDPPPADALPYSSETIYVRFVDKYIGDLYIRGEISFSLYGVTYDMTNFRDVTFSLFSIMKAERFSAIIYIEPVKEGILIYSMSGIYLPEFIVSRVNLIPNMNRHVSVLLSWIIEGLERESKRQKPRFYQLPREEGP